MNAKQILEKALGVDLKKPQTIVEAANTALGLNNVTVGCEVAIIDDPTFPTSGLKGKVKKIDLDSGTATVQLHNGDEVPVKEFFSARLFTNEVLTELDENVIKPTFKFPETQDGIDTMEIDELEDLTPTEEHDL